MCPPYPRLVPVYIMGAVASPSGLSITVPTTLRQRFVVGTASPSELEYFVVVNRYVLRPYMRVSRNKARKKKSSHGLLATLAETSKFQTGNPDLKTGAFGYLRL